MSDFDPPEADNEDGGFGALLEQARSRTAGCSVVTVTAADIAGATPTPAANPLARAARRAFPGAWFATASRGVLEVAGRDGTRRWELDGGTASFLAASLDGHQIEAFAFVLGEPEFSPRSRPVAATGKAA